MDHRPHRLLWPVTTLAVLLVAGAFAVVSVLDTDDAEAADLDLMFSTSSEKARADRPWRLKDGEKVLTGAVGSVSDGRLVVRKDGGAEVTVPTDGDTKVRGNRNRSVADLSPGERVIVKAGADGTADVVLAVRAHAGGTVTSLDGDRATVVRPGGQTVTLDLSGVPERPAVGTVILARGTTADDGTVKVEQLRELPTLG
jgi:hypothetical protein